MPIAAFTRTKGKYKPDTLEGGGGSKSPKPPEPAKPPQTAKAPQTQVYKDRAQAAGRGGMSAGYQSTLMTGAQGVQNDSIAGALAGRVMPAVSNVFTSSTLG